MKKYSTSLIIRDIQITTIMKYYLTAVRMAIINKSTNNKCWRECGEKRTLFTVGGNVNWYNYYGKQYGDSSENYRTTIDPKNPLLDIHPDRNFFFLFFLFFCLFLGLHPQQYGGSQARGLIGAVATCLPQSHSNSGSKPCLWPTPAHGNAISLTHWERPGIEPTTSWFLVRFINHCTTMGTPGWNFHSKRYKHPYVQCSTVHNSKTWKSKCPLTEEWIKKMWYIYTVEYYLAIKKGHNKAICSNMDATRYSYTKWSKSERERQIPHEIINTENLKYGTNDSIYKTETDHAHRADLCLQRGREKEMDWGVCGG